MPTIFNIIDTIKSIINGDIPNSLDDIVSIPVDWFIDNMSQIFSWLIMFIKNTFPFFESAGHSFFEVFKIESFSDMIDLGYMFMGIASFLLLIKLILWFMGG